MESRIITVVNTNNQTKTALNSTAETLGELKQDLTTANIDFNNMAFFEGLTKIELKSDASILPKDVSYKGQITNNLVIMLTTQNKQIRSGYLNRKECYANIKLNNLQDEVIKTFGRNYTQVSTEGLNKLINGNFNKTKNTTIEKALKKDTTPETSNEKALKEEIETLKRTVHCLNGQIETYKEEIEKLQNKAKIPYSDDEINSILEF